MSASTSRAGTGVLGRVNIRGMVRAVRSSGVHTPKLGSKAVFIKTHLTTTLTISEERGDQRYSR